MPPVGQHFFNFTGIGTQAHEVKGGAKTRLLHHAKGRAAHAFFKARLHQPDFTHVAGQLAASGHIANAGMKHIVNGILQSRVRVLALLHAQVPTVAHIGPQHAGQQEAGRHRFAFAHAAVGVFEGGIDKNLLRALHHHVKQRVNAARHAQQFELFNGGQSMTGLQQLEHFVKQAALRHVGQQLLRFDQGRCRFGFELEAQAAELGGKAHGADDAHRVFAVAGGCVANHADDALFAVFDALVVVHHDLRLGVVVHGVDGEVTAHRVLVLRSPDVVAQHPARGVHGVLHAGEFVLAGALIARHGFGRGVVHVGAEGGDFNHLVVAAPAVHHVHDTKAPANDEGAPEQAFHLLGRGVGGHVKVFGRQAHHQVAHGAAHNVSLVTRVLEGAHHVYGAFIHQRRVNAVALYANFLALAQTEFFSMHRYVRCVCCGRLAQQFVDEFFNH